MKGILPVLLVLVALSGCVQGPVGACGSEPSGAAHFRVHLDESLQNYSLEGGNVSFLQVADINERPTPTTTEERANLRDGCAWYTLPDGYYHIVVRFPHATLEEKEFFEERPEKLVGQDVEWNLGFHDG